MVITRTTRKKNEHSTLWVRMGEFYQQLSAYIINFVKVAEARKTTMGHITTDHLDQSRIAIPSMSVLERFAEIVRPVHEMIGKYQQQNRELAELRDWLPPMLMNGQAVVE